MKNNIDIIENGNMKKTDKTYNGHKNYNYWNVALWFGNDEGLYRTALDYIRHTKTRDQAARGLMEILPEATPDGVEYNYSNVRAAIAGLE